MHKESSETTSNGPPYSENFDFSGRIQSHPPNSFQYRFGRKISPADRRMFERKYKLND